MYIILAVYMVKSLLLNQLKLDLEGIRDCVTAIFHN